LRTPLPKSSNSPFSLNISTKQKPVLGSSTVTYENVKQIAALLV
jgi:hypothetical protein